MYQGPWELVLSISVIPLWFFQLLFYIALAHDFKQADNPLNPRTLDSESEGTHFDSIPSASLPWGSCSVLLSAWVTYKMEICFGKDQIKHHEHVRESTQHSSAQYVWLMLAFMPDILCSGFSQNKIRAIHSFS